jgi:serine/threonine-protein kinase/endoribonuclease IRE1
MFLSITMLYLIAEVPEGFIRIGKIMFNPQDVLGHGCEGTFVYR